MLKRKRDYYLQLYIYISKYKLDIKMMQYLLILKNSANHVVLKTG